MNKLQRIRDEYSWWMKCDKCGKEFIASVGGSVLTCPNCGRVWL